MSGMSAPGGGAPPQIPPWLQEQVAKFQKTQQELQMISMQKQQLESEKVNVSRTLDELKKASDDETVYKFAGSVLIRTTRADMLSELEERQELANTRSAVTGKQESRLVESLKEQEAKITEAMRRGMTQPPSPPQPSSLSSSSSSSSSQTAPSP